MTPTIFLPWQHPWLQSLSVKNQISLFATFLSGTRGLPRNRHGAHIVLTLPIRLLGVDDPCARWNLGILVVIKTGSAAWLLSWQWHDSCHFVSFVMPFLLPSLKITALIFLEIFLIQYFIVLMEWSMTSSLPSFAQYKNVNISRTKKDIPKRKTPFLLTLKGLSNKELLFFTS